MLEICTQKPTNQVQIKIMVKTDSKTITGKIIHVSQSIARSTSWGCTLFKGQEVIVDVRCKQKKRRMHMYIRADSFLGSLGITNKIAHKRWQLTIHGEQTTNNRGVLVIDNLAPCARIIKDVELNQYF